ncbi:serine/threonine-protein kinase [Nocardia sp. NPDC052316]|uniref:serine/threonine-protein kinase n=1 Tax=Nocardia sp. NPDC052316 TaxID=3364329 RepID=UPI0037CC83C8
MLQPGEIFAGYTIERLLGRGGMGSVYLARHPRLPRLTAMKLLNPEVFHDKEIRTRFEREADLVARLDHPNIVTVFDRGVEDERLWISMQYIDGTDAAGVDARSLPPQRAVQIIGETAKALDFAHRRGVLHRDVKPANILLERTAGAGERVFLTDFGIARFRDDTGRLTQTGTFTATLAYASPEQLSGALLDHRSDQYSLACTLFRLLTGTVPFDATNPVAVIQGHLQVPPPPVSRLRPGLPVALDAVLAKAMAKRPDGRFDSCAEFAGAAWHALTAPQQFAQPVAPSQFTPSSPPNEQRAVGKDGPGAGPVRSGPVPARRPKSNAKLGGGIGVLLVLGLIASVLMSARGETGSAGPTVTTTATTPRATVMADPTEAPTSAPPATTADPAQVGANAAALSAEFPAMLPKTTAQQLVQSGTGYNKAGCFAYDPASAPTIDDEDPAFGTWLVMWRCFGGTENKAAFSFYLYNSPADVRAALDALPANDRTTATNHGHAYTNYTLHNSSSRRPRMITEFTADPQRAAILMYSAGFIATESELMQWWTDAPLN